MFQHLVVTNKLVTYNYFMDELKDYELDLLVENINYSYKTEWEMTRYLLWGVLAPYQKGHKTPEQLFPLPTDNTDKDTEISNEDIMRLKARSKEFEKLFKKT